MLDHGIVPIDHGGKTILLPDEITRMAFLWSLQDEPESRGIALAFHTIQAPPATLKPHFLALAQTHTVSRLIGTGCQLLSRIAINMLSYPAGSGIGRIGMESIFRKAVFLTKSQESRVAFLLLGLGEIAGLLPTRISPHLLEPFHGFPKQGVIGTACG